MLVFIDAPSFEVDAEGIAAMRLREQAFREFLEGLADELNSSLDGFQVRLTHLDTDDYLEFVPVE